MKPSDGTKQLRGIDIQYTGQLIYVWQLIYENVLVMKQLFIDSVANNFCMSF